MRILAAALLSVLPLCAQQKAVFYMTDSADSIRSYFEHWDRIDILIPTVYETDGTGLLSGALNPRVREHSRERRVPVMPIIVNSGFKGDLMHQLVSSQEAVRRMIDGLVAECKENGWIGIQFDFEGISFLDSEAYTNLIKKTAAAFRREKLQLSLAAVPRSSDYAGRGGYSRWMWANWRAAFDLKAIEPHLDFISWMTYDQHTRHTPPGPIAGMPWVERCTQYALQFVPKAKLSLGIPTYGRHWYAGQRERTAEPDILLSSIGAPAAVELAAQMKAEIQWDSVEKAPWFWFVRDNNREYVFFSDARSILERYEYAKRMGLHGFSSWVLGQEDPEIWKRLPVARR
jgi:spore germination protein YaaH